MFCQAQAAVQTKGVLVVFQHSIPTCGKEAMETNFHTQELFQGKYKAVLLAKSGGCDFNEDKKTYVVHMSDQCYTSWFSPMNCK